MQASLPPCTCSHGWLAGVLTEFPPTSVTFSMFLLIKFSFTPILIPSAYKLGWCWDSEVARGRANPWIQVCMTLCFFLYVLAAWENWQVLLLIKVENLNTNWDENAEEAASRILTQKLKAFKDLQYVLAVRISVCCHKIRTKDLTAGRFLKLYTHFASRLYVETFINTLIKWLLSHRA